MILISLNTGQAEHDVYRKPVKEFRSREHRMENMKPQNHFVARNEDNNKRNEKLNFKY